MLRDEIRGCMLSFEADNGEVLASFAFPADFTGFDGHFPGNPILPGICTLQSAIVMLEHAGLRRTSIREIRFAKFFTVVGPEETVQFVCRPDPHDPNSVHVTARCGDRKVADIGLSVTYGPDPEPRSQTE